jgi:hypothetical protein
MIYIANYGDVNPFEHGGVFVFDCEDGYFRIVEVINLESNANPFATTVRFFDVSQEDMQKSLEEVAKSCGWDVSDLNKPDGEMDWGFVATQMIPLCLAAPFASADYEKFTELAYDLYHGDFMLPEFYQDISRYLEMMPEEDDIVETYTADFTDGCVEELAKRMDVEEEDVFKAIKKNGIVYFDSVLSNFDFKELIYFQEKLRGSFRQLGRDFASFVFYSEPLDNKSYPMLERVEEVFYPSKLRSDVLFREV